jgi:hypothetical protein
MPIEVSRNSIYPRGFERSDLSGLTPYCAKLCSPLASTTNTPASFFLEMTVQFNLAPMQKEYVIRVEQWICEPYDILCPADNGPGIDKALPTSSRSFL